MTHETGMIRCKPSVRDALKRLSDGIAIGVVLEWLVSQYADEIRAFAAGAKEQVKGCAEWEASLTPEDRADMDAWEARVKSDPHNTPMMWSPPSDGVSELPGFTIRMSRGRPRGAKDVKQRIRRRKLPLVEVRS